MLLTELTGVSAWHQTPYGKVSSSWRIKGSQLLLDVTVPVNTTAAVYVPGKNAQLDGVKTDTVRKIGSGTYRFTSDL